MIPIYPINEETLSPHYGRMVCVILHDGSRYVGQLTRCYNGQVVLDGDLTSSSSPNEVPDKVKRHKKRNTPSKVKKTDKIANISTLVPPPYYPSYTSAYDGYGYGGAVALDLALIALFFLLV